MPEEIAGGWASNGELIVGLVGPIGVDLVSLSNTLEQELLTVEYVTRTVRLTELLQALPGYGIQPGIPLDERYDALMTNGNRLRDTLQRADAMAILGVAGVQSKRDEFTDANVLRRAYILRQMKRPEEVETLRRLYGENFVLIAALGDKQQRVERLAAQITNSLSAATVTDQHRARALHLMDRDEQEGLTRGQNLRDTFGSADLFVDPSDVQGLQSAIRRFVDLLFGRCVRTPTRDEYAMFHAFGSALRSGQLGRQVGAALIDDHGSIVATGTNDVPKYGGGLYWEDDEPDERDHKRGVDISDTRRSQMMSEVFVRLRDGGWLSAERAAQHPQELADEALRGPAAIMKSTRLDSIIEFMRAVHAEQAAIAEAARRGVRSAGCDLVVTTFPCHECTGLIVAAGVERVCYISPYPKSLAVELYDDSISLGNEPGKVRFESFLGVAPRSYVRLFVDDLKRKHPDGTVWIRSGAECQLRLTYNGSRPDIAEAENAVVWTLGLLNEGPGQADNPTVPNSATPTRDDATEATSEGEP